MQGATLQAHPVDLAKLRTVLLPDEVVLEYVLADPTSFCLVIDQKRAVIVSLPAGEKELRKQRTGTWVKSRQRSTTIQTRGNCTTCCSAPFGNCRGPPD